jgi:hypothetical protein
VNFEKKNLAEKMKKSELLADFIKKLRTDL